MFVSMWISNTAAVAMMCPIMQAVLEELETVTKFNKKIDSSDCFNFFLYFSKDFVKCTLKRRALQNPKNVCCKAMKLLMST